MDNKDIIQYVNDDIEENSVMVVKGKRRKKKGSLFKRLFCIALIAVACYYTYQNFGEIRSLANKLIVQYRNGQANKSQPVDSNTDTDTDTNSGSYDDSNITDLPENDIQIPTDALNIFESTGKFVEIYNEAEIEIDYSKLPEDFITVEDIYKKYGNEAPVVLIIHSSCKESYSNGTYYYTNDSFYSNENNVSTVGKVICDTLNESNINAIHIDDIFANGGIYNSRAEYESCLSEALKRYPSISYVFDISRDVLINDDLTMNKMIASINGSCVAQIKIAVGSSTDKSKAFWHKNLAFAKMLATENSDLIYNVTLAGFELSQNIAPVSIKIDVGSYSNTINDAILAGKELAKSICNMLHKS